MEPRRSRVQGGVNQPFQLKVEESEEKKQRGLSGDEEDEVAEVTWLAAARQSARLMAMFE